MAVATEPRGGPHTGANQISPSEPAELTPKLADEELELRLYAHFPPALIGKTGT